MSKTVSSIEEIKEYKKLLEMGAINQEEFNKKKKELLNLTEQTTENNKINNDVEEKYKGLALSGFIMGAIGIFVFPVFGIISVVFGVIAILNNKNNEKWNKAVWQYENKALGYGRSSLVIGIGNIFYLVIKIMENL